MINWKTVIFKTIFFYGFSISLLFLNILIFFLTFGSGASSSRIGEIWYVDFLMNYLPLILPSLFLLYIILISKKNKELIKFNSNIIVLILLIILYIFREEFIGLIMILD